MGEMLGKADKKTILEILNIGKSSGFTFRNGLERLSQRVVEILNTTPNVTLKSRAKVQKLELRDDKVLRDKLQR